MICREGYSSIVLASASPRRRELVARLGLAVEVAPTDIDETPREGEPPPVYALRTAREKLRAAAAGRPDKPVIAADTVVGVGGEILGKPTDRRHAREMIARLAGRTHMVFTAVAVGWHTAEACHLEAARVSFAAACGEILDWYAQSGEGDDKAGAYAVQGAGAVLVPRVEGNVQAIVGLPLAVLPALFLRVGLQLLRRDGRLVLSPRA